MRAAIITSSDSGYAGKREDVSGPVIAEMVREAGYEVVWQKVLPDDQAMLEEAMKEICDEGKADLLLTTGGTGFSPRDVMPERRWRSRNGWFRVSRRRCGHTAYNLQSGRC